MADAATAASPYDVNVEDAGPARKRLTITVPAATIAEKLTDSMGVLANTAQIPGFRKGRAPKSLLQKRFGGAVRDEARGQLISESYQHAIQEHGLKPVSEPEPVDDLDELELKEDADFSFKVEVEVVPEFALPKLDKLKIKRPVAETTDEMINEEIERQCTRFGEVKETTDAFKPGDKVVGPGHVMKEGDDEPFFTHEEVDIIVPEKDDGGNGAVLGLLVEGLHSMLAGKKVGEVLDIEVTGPESHELEHIRGKKLTIHVEIQKAMRIDPAEVQGVIDAYGLESEDMLREQITHALEQRIEAEQQGAMREQVYRYLADSADFDLPAKMTENQTTRLLERQRLELMYKGGLTPEAVEQRIAEVRGEASDEIRRRLKLQFLLHRLADNRDISVNEQEVNGRISMIAMQRGVRPEKLRQDLIQSGMISQIGTQIRDHKAVDTVVADAEVSDVTADEWNTLVEEDRVAATA